MITKALRMAKEWSGCQEKKAKPQQRTPTRIKAPAGCALLRTDATWRAPSQMAGLGWSIKLGSKVISGSSAADAVGSALIAKGMAMRKAISESKTLGLKKMVCESDSSQLIRALKGVEVPLELYGIISDIVDLSFHFEFISFNWIPRDKNFAADLLAKQGLVDGEVFMTIT